jgi:hypothetical protein
VHFYMFKTVFMAYVKISLAGNVLLAGAGSEISAVIVARKTDLSGNGIRVKIGDIFYKVKSLGGASVCGGQITS